eukprot:snap_masked-scaffold_9-processed-gene-13.84-mRNA-1 protein AED:1.00 eAED:1.00 QI:0/0/0/0/1/1/3/0/160
MFKNLSFNKNILKIGVQEHVQDKVIISSIKNYLKTNKAIKILKDGCHTRFEVVSEDIVEFQEIVDSHPSVHVLDFLRGLLNLKKRVKVKKIAYSALQSEYEEDKLLNEVPVILMGDLRTGKTFQKETSSTLVLEDYEIFQVKDYVNEFKPLTKYDMSVQK